MSHHHATKSMQDLKGMSTDMLNAELAELGSNLMMARTAQMNKKDTTDTKKIASIRKGIARVKTVITLRLREEAKKQYEGKKWVPKELKPKLTRAMRRRLSPEQSRKQVTSVFRRTSQWAPKQFVLLKDM